MDGERTIAEFSHQAEAFAGASVYWHPETLDALVAALPLQPGERWLDVACGPGIVTRALAEHVGLAVGLDLTPAMLERARLDAGGRANVRFVPGDAAALPWADGAFDGAVTRFSLHHLEDPGRALAEMARVVRPGGTVAVADHLTATDGPAASWHNELERLRDPSHRRSLAEEEIVGLGEACGLRPVSRSTASFDLDFEEWLTRGSGGPAHRARITAEAAAPPPAAAPFFRLEGARLHLRLGIAVWRKRPHEAGGKNP